MCDLHGAAMKGDLLSVQVLLDDMVDVNLKHRSGETALHSASSEGHTDVIEELLDGGADIDVQNWNGQTALHLSALKGHSQATQLLLCAGADWAIKTQYSGMTALHLATYNGHLEVVQVLLKHQGDTITDHVFKKAEFYSPTIEIRREFERQELQDGDTDLTEDSTTLNGYHMEEHDQEVTETSSSKTDTDIGGRNNITNNHPSVPLSKSDTSEDRKSDHLPKPSTESINTTNTCTAKKTTVKNAKKNIYGKVELPTISKSQTPYKKLTYKKKERKSPSVSIDKKLDYSSKYKERQKHSL